MCSFWSASHSHFPFQLKWRCSCSTAASFKVELKSQRRIRGQIQPRDHWKTSLLLPVVSIWIRKIPEYSCLDKMAQHLATEFVPLGLS
ncbi:hypothetical protein AOLI_G00262830 [Acnodon oligacanthus]